MKRSPLVVRLLLPLAMALPCLCPETARPGPEPDPGTGGGPPPTVTTLTASGVTGTGGQLNGQVNPQGAAATGWFEWGLTAGYGNATPAQALGRGTTPTNFQSVLGGLTSGVTYHFRALASNTFGLGVGLDQTFTASPPFTNRPVPGLPAVSAGAVSWADYDQDGRLDFLLTGSTGTNAISQLWHNTGNGFAPVPVAGLPGVERSAIAWGDFDNDGRLDFLLTGAAGSNAVSQLWRNTGAGFALVPVPGLPGVERGSVAWGDYDHDGRLDFLLTGASESGAVAQIWRNTGGGFSPVTIPGLPGVLDSAVEWADYDRDGRLDFLLTGTHASQPVSQLWHHTGSGFTNFPIAGLPGVSSGRVCWGDYDNDSRPDFLLAGFTGSIRVSQLWRNTGNGFANVPIAGLPGIERGTIAWGDYDNDGRLDFVFSGFNGSSRLAQLWRNTGSGFAKVPNQVLPGVEASAFAWGDADNDGRLDFLLTGSASAGPLAQFWHSTVPATNTPPAAPTGLEAQVSGTGVTLSWAAASDAQTFAHGLSYNVVLATASNAVDVAAPLAELATGFRRVVRLGGAGANRAWTFTNLPPAPVYYWSVQAIDSAFAGGPFAPVQTFSLDASLSLVCPPDLIVSNVPGQCAAAPVALAVFADGRPMPEVVCRLADRVITSPATFPSGTNMVTCTASNLAGTRTCSFRVIVRDLEAPVIHCPVAQAVALPAGSSFVPVAFTVDATDNCDAQVETTCAPVSGSLFPVGTTTVHCTAADAAGNRSACAFTVTVSPSEFALVVAWSPPVSFGTVAWGDYDNDGRLDVVVTGTAGGRYATEIWRNTGTNFISISTSLPALYVSTAAWGDYNNDGWLDLALAGRSTNLVLMAQIWRNTGGGFVNLDAGLPGVADGALAWGDYDNDGRLDLLLTGDTGTGRVAQVWRNTGTNFIDIRAGLPGVSTGSAAWGDYDDDGRLDILITGLATDGTRLAQIWRNTGSGFVNAQAGLPAVSAGGVAWGDYDNDGRLDLVLTGNTGVRALTQIWRNTGNGFSNLNAALPAVLESSAAWGDYDNDGWLDLLLTGNSSSRFLTQIWRNTGTNFVNTPSGLPGVRLGMAAWGDEDNDGRLDVFLMGDTNSNAQVTEIWRNLHGPPNSPPAAPTNLSAAPGVGWGTLSWSAASDSQTPSRALSYNLRVGTTPDGGDIVSPMSAANGLRRVPRLGNAQQARSARLVLEPGRTYYWSVQAVDGGWVGGPFAATQSFTVPSIPAPHLTQLEVTATGVFRFGFTNANGSDFRVLAATDPALPEWQWDDLGSATPIGGGLYEFLDPAAPPFPQRFYRLVFP